MPKNDIHFENVYPNGTNTEMRVAKWGNSLAVRLPAAVVEALSLCEGDEIEIHAMDGQQIAIVRRPDPKELLLRIRKYRGRMPADFTFDREQANERG